MKLKLVIVIRVLVVPLTLAIMMCGCATTGGPPARVRTITDPEFGLLKVGMPISTVRGMLGAPYSSHTMQFGEATAAPWTGLVFVYFDGRDPRFAYRERYFKTRLVFATVRADTLLNHWSIEKKDIAPFVSKKKSPRSDGSAAALR